MVNQPTRNAIVKLPGLFTKRIIVPEVVDFKTADDETVRHYKQKCYRISQYNKTLPEARKEIEEGGNISWKERQNTKRKRPRRRKKSPITVNRKSQNKNNSLKEKI